MTMLSALFIAVVCGLVIGALAGLLGIGGGAMIVPVLRLGFGLTALQSTATSLFTIILTSCSGAAGRLRNRTANLKAGLAIGLSGACIAPLGTPLAHHLGNLEVMLLSCCAFLYIAIKMIRRGLATPKSAARQAAQPEQLERPRRLPQADAVPNIPVGHTVTELMLTVKNMLYAIAIGACAGLASSVLGIGGGFVIIPLCTSVFGFTMKEATGTSLMAILPLATTGTIAHALAGDVAFVYGAAIALGSIPGALLGAKISRYAPERTLRLLFGSILVAMTVVLVLNECGVLG